MSVNRTDVNRVPGVSSTSISFDQPSKNIRREYISRSYSFLCTPYTYTELSYELTIVSSFFFFFVYIPRLYCKKKEYLLFERNVVSLLDFSIVRAYRGRLPSTRRPAFSQSPTESQRPRSPYESATCVGELPFHYARHAKRNERRRRRGGVEAGSSVA